MKILFFVDVHGDRDALAQLIKQAKEEKVDLIVCAGDISEMGQELKKLIKSMKIGIPMLIIYGNHEDDESIKDAINGQKWVTNIHKKALRMEHILFLGCGGGGLSQYHRPFEKSEKQFSEKIDKFEGKSVLVTHAPPHKTKLDALGMHNSGVKSIRVFIEKKQPDYAISGHLHENAGKKDKIGKTVVINPGKKGVVLEL